MTGAVTDAAVGGDALNRPEQASPEVRKAARTALMGRPRTIKTVEEFDQLIAEYFALTEVAEEGITFSGLILYVGLYSHESFNDQANRSPEFAASVKRAKMAVAKSYELDLRKDRPAGAIFALKNMGWSDQQVLEIRGVVGRLDMSRMSPEQLARFTAGEPLVQVLATGAELHRGALPPGEQAEMIPEAQPTDSASVPPRVATPDKTSG